MAGMNIPTWHYKIEEIAGAVQPSPNQVQLINAKLDELGMQGWEAVTTVVGQPGHVFILFKRQGPQTVHLSDAA